MRYYRNSGHAESPEEKSNANIMSVYKETWWCRWCGNTYRHFEQPQRDGFCKNACKQAHHRAYKKYVTAKTGPRRAFSKSLTSQ